jgi:hypothetical protein
MIGLTVGLPIFLRANDGYDVVVPGQICRATIRDSHQRGLLSESACL